MPPVSRRYSRLIALTGLTPAALATPMTRIAAAQPTATARPWRLALPDRVLLVAAGLRTNLTTRALAAVFGISQSMTVRIQRTCCRSWPDYARPEPTPATSAAAPGFSTARSSQCTTSPVLRCRRTIGAASTCTS
ncbi:transposase family protein [Dactylosporangium darangshiense]|uniref:transposase family protein n=1 Tax=Dactylosporangium darangshiense TaxID=579108 RepID=UPI00363A26FD